MAHDDLCPCVTTGVYETCKCTFIDSIVRRERRRLIADGWLPGEQHEAIVATTRARAVQGTGDAIVRAISDATHADPCDCLRCVGMVRAAQIAEGITRDLA